MPLSSWAARYNTGLLNELTPKDVVFSFLSSSAAHEESVCFACFVNSAYLHPWSVPVPMCDMLILDCLCSDET